MRSFAITAFATLAFGIFCSAAPAPLVGREIAKVDVDVKVRSSSSGSSSESPSLEDCLDKVVTDVTKIVEEISQFLLYAACILFLINYLPAALKPEECTVEILEPLLEDVVEILEFAVSEVKDLVDLDITALLGGLLDIGGLCKLIADVICVREFSLLSYLELISFVFQLIVKLVELVIKIVTDLVKADLEALLDKIISLLCELLTCIFNLLGSLLGEVLSILIGLLGDVVQLIISLKLTELIKVLCITV